MKKVSGIINAGTLVGKALPKHIGIKKSISPAGRKSDFTAARNKYETTTEIPQIAFFLCTPAGKILAANDAAVTLSGYSLPELINARLKKVFGKDDSNNAFFKKILGGGVYTAAGVRKNGEQFFYELTSVLFTNEHNERRVNIMLVSSPEISKAQQNISVLMNHKEENYMLVDRQMRIIEFDTQFAEAYRLFFSKDIKTRDSILQHPSASVLKKTISIYKKVFKGEKINTELDITTINGEELIIDGYFKPIKNRQGKIVAALTIYRDVTEKKKAERLLIASEKRYKALVENGSDAVTVFTQDAKPVYISASINNVLGYTETAAMQDGLFLSVHPDDLSALKAVWKTILATPGASVRGYIYRMHHKDGSWRWVESTITNMLCNAPVAGIVSNFRDVSERVAAEEKIKQSEENLNAIFENTREGFVLIDTAYKIKTFNANARLNLFLPTEMQAGANLFDFIEEANKAFLEKIIHEALKGESFQYEHLTNNKLTNEPLWINLAITPVKQAGIITAVCITGRIITKQKATEKKISLTQNLLNRAESIAQIGSAEINFYTNKRIWSDEFYRIVGLEPGSMPPSAEGLLQFLHPEEKEPYLNWVKNGLTNKIESQQIESRLIRADGEERNIMAYGSTTYNAEGKADTLIGVIQDITDRKKMEQALKVSREIYQSLFYQNPSAVFSLDMEGNFSSVNHIVAINMACTEEELLHLHYSAFVYPEDLALANLHFDKTKKGAAQEYEMRIWTANGNLMSALMISLPIIVNNNIIGVYCIANDITKEKNAKIELSKTLADKQRILDFSLDVICAFNGEGKFIQASKACKDVWGYEPEELIGNKFIDMVVEEDRAVTLKMAAAIAAGGPATRNFENRFIKKDRTVVNLVWSARWDENDKTMYCIAKDASEKKAQEKALVLSEQRYRDLFNNNPLPLYIFDFTNRNIIEVNNAALKKYSYSREKFLCLTLRDIVSAADFRAFENVLKDENSFTQVSKRIWKHKKKNSGIMYMNITGNVIDYKGTRCALMLLDDITEKIIAEEQKEFERRDKEALINTTNDQIWSVSNDFKLIAGNKAFVNSIKLISGKTIMQGDQLLTKDIFTGKMLDFWQEMYSRSLSGESFKKEVTIPDPATATQQWNEVSFSPIYDGKAITGVACYRRNITDNKLHQIELLNTNKKLETAQQMARLGYWELTIKDNTSFWSAELYNIFGLKQTSPRITFNQIIDVVYPDDKKTVIKNYKLAIAGQQPLNQEHRILLKDGSVKTVVQKGTLVYDEQGQPVALEGTAQDITQAKLAEKAIKDSEEKYRMIFNSNPLPNWIFDLESLQILEVNNAAIAHYGYSRKEFSNMLINDLFIKEEVASAIKINQEARYQGIKNFGQWQHVKKNGEVINVDITGHAIFYNNKNAVMIVSNDITGIIQAQQALVKSNERFEYATKATFDAIWDHDLVNNTMFWGEGFNSLFGYNVNELELSVLDREKFTHPDDKQRVLDSLNDVIKDAHQTYWQSEYRFKKNDESYATVIDCALVVRDNSGMPYRIIGAMQDITERIQSEITLKELNNQLNKRAAELAGSNAELEQFVLHSIARPAGTVKNGKQFFRPDTKKIRAPA